MAVTDDQVELVRALIAGVPAGRVTTYGDVACAAGLSSPRIVGWILRTDGADLPWHRVVPASGRPSAPRSAEQLERLRSEGVPAVDGKVDLCALRHRF
ncbi:MGMT family protein [Mycolicibacter hiberniae]|uniref:DNA methyltransferase n=1 Tax=Mycolicibacter hiberniae TaxID=29314 RepID=A0A7I7X2U7_9MYCO|nr:MGMT family protein [Mycolicibacter hiberniae]MCV7088174.1 MGMT family protein [Mycolicibacter hiberniae]ORV72485.1 DNA methyltransferase [Mycolicibacter hiberniae]BBZ23924.1 DNA methyltransferase [Mycolicibacter hiberniae]